MSSNIPAFNVGHEIDVQGNYRLYYFMGGTNLDSPFLDKFWDELATKQEAEGTSLEPLNITKIDFTTYHLPKGYHGRKIFVQKHAEDDPDYTKGTHPGYDAYETFKKIELIAKKVFGNFVIDPDASQNIQKFIDAIDDVKKETGVNLFTMNPAYNGIHQLSKEVAFIYGKDNKAEKSSIIEKTNHVFKIKIIGLAIIFLVAFLFNKFFNK